MKLSNVVRKAPRDGLLAEEENMHTDPYSLSKEKALKGVFETLLFSAEQKVF